MQIITFPSSHESLTPIWIIEELFSPFFLSEGGKTLGGGVGSSGRDGIHRPCQSSEFTSRRNSLLILSTTLESDNLKSDKQELFSIFQMLFQVQY